MQLPSIDQLRAHDAINAADSMQHRNLLAPILYCHLCLRCDVTIHATIHPRSIFKLDGMSSVTLTTDWWVVLVAFMEVVTDSLT